MKTYKVKNYKGNLVESLSKFQKAYKGMKIVEAVEEDGCLKIKAEESLQGKFKTRMFFADDIIPKEEIESDEKKYKVSYKKDTKHPASTQDGWPYIVIAQDKEHFIKWFKERYMGSEYSEEEIQDALADYI